jgi:hypothetical protein
MNKQIYIASLVCSIMATIALVYWSLIHTPILHTIAVAGICGANVMTHITIIKGDK